MVMSGSRPSRRTAVPRQSHFRKISSASKFDRPYDSEFLPNAPPQSEASELLKKGSTGSGKSVSGKSSKAAAARSSARTASGNQKPPRKFHKRLYVSAHSENRPLRSSAVQKSMGYSPYQSSSLRERYAIRSKKYLGRSAAPATGSRGKTRTTLVAKDCKAGRGRSLRLCA